MVPQVAHVSVSVSVSVSEREFVRVCARARASVCKNYAGWSSHPYTDEKEYGDFIVSAQLWKTGSCVSIALLVMRV